MTHFYIIFLSVLVVVSSLRIPVTLLNRSEMSAVELGYPIGYLIQDISRGDPPEFPIDTGIMSPLEYPIMEIHAGVMLLNILIIYLFLGTCLSLYRLVFRTNSNKNA